VNECTDGEVLRARCSVLEHARARERRRARNPLIAAVRLLYLW
jgi:hypothetical protein